MKKSLTIALEDQTLDELMTILIDEDSESALTFLKILFGRKARELLESG